MLASVLRAHPPNQNGRRMRHALPKALREHARRFCSVFRIGKRFTSGIARICRLGATRLLTTSGR